MLFSYSLSPGELMLFFLCSMITGMAKAGLKGIGMVIVPVMALIFGARPSTGILLPVLVMADIMAVIYWRKYAEWKYIIKLLPPALAGIVIAMITGKLINASQFSIILSSIVIIMLVMMLANDIFRKNREKIPAGKGFAALTGLSGGFATMIGNSAGPVFNLYFLAMRLPKKEFIGTVAWFFLIVNVIKVPLHVFAWNTIDINSFMLSITALPAIALGIAAGIYLVKLFPEKVYRYFVIIVTAASALVLLIK